MAHLAIDNTHREALVDDYPWLDADEDSCAVKKALGAAIISWPSGRRTFEFYGANAVITLTEYEGARDVLTLVALKERDLQETLDTFRASIWRDGFYVKKQGRRPKARRALAIEWLAPSSYRGPAPERGGVIPSA